MRTLPDDLFDRGPSAPFRPAARRAIEFLGRTVELCWLPERRSRRGVPGVDRPPFDADPASRIVREEALWEGSDLAVTPNLFPFASRQILLWSTRSMREPDAAMLESAFEFATAHGATALLNSIGAAASIARAHLHLVDERLWFLPELPTSPVDEPWRDLLENVEVARLAPPFPADVVVLRGAPVARSRALRRLLDLRTCPAFNAVDDGQGTWMMPRSAREITAPWFPQALGAAELWGRWCFLDQAAFDAATSEGLAAALGVGGYPNPRVH
jgi:hypothetical protein